MLAEVVVNTNTTGGAITAIAATAVMAFVVVQFVNLLKSARAKDWNAVVTPLIAVAGAAGAILLAQASAHFGAWTIPGIDVPVSDLNAGDIVIASVAVGLGFGGFLVDRTKARDNSQSAAYPPLIPGTPPPDA